MIRQSLYHLIFIIGILVPAKVIVWWYIKKMRVESLSINEIIICLFVCYQAIIFANINLNLNWNTTNILPRQSLIWPSLNPCTMINPVLLTYSKTNKLKLMSMKYSPFCPWTNELNLQVCQMKFTLILNRIFSDEWKHSPVSLTIIHVKNHKSHNAPNKYPAIHHFVTEMCMCAHFCYKVVHCGIRNLCIVGFMWQVIQPLSAMLLTSSHKFAYVLLKQTSITLLDRVGPWEMWK